MSTKISILKITFFLAYFIFLYVLYFNLFNDGPVVYGDFSTSFFFKKGLMFTNMFALWLNNSFLGYPALYYSLLRIPYYFINDVINSVFGYQNYWFYFIVSHYLRFLTFYYVCRKFNDKFLISFFLSIAYSFSPIFIDRFSHLLITFGLIGMPLIFWSYYSEKEKLFKRQITLIIGLLFVVNSMHVLFLTGMLVLLSSIFKISRNGKDLPCLIKDYLKISLLPFLIFSYIWIPFAFAYFFSTSNPISQVSVNADSWRNGLTEGANFFKNILGVGYKFSSFTIFDLPYLFVPFFILLIFLLFKKGKNSDLGLFSIYLLFLAFGIGFIFSLPRQIWILFPGIGSIKDPSYFLLISNFLFFLFVSTSLTNKWIVKWTVAACTLFLIAIYTFALYKTSYYHTVKIPSSYYSISQQLGSGRTLILPFGWVNSYTWSNGITSGFFNMFLSDKKIVGQSIVEGTPPLTIKTIENLETCFLTNCRKLESYLNLIEIENILYIKNNTSKSGFTLEKYDKSIKLLEDAGITFKKVDNNDYSIFEIKNNVKNHQQLTTKIGSGYVIKIENKTLSDNPFLFLNESFDPNWLAFYGEKDFCQTNTQDFLSKVKVDLYVLSSLINNQRKINSHLTYKSFGNKWIIKNASSFEKCNENKQVFIIYYLPQLFFNLGIVFSLSSGIALIALNIKSLMKK